MTNIDVALGYDSNGTAIPAVSITVEDAQLISRLVSRNGSSCFELLYQFSTLCFLETVRIRLYSENRLNSTPVESRNTVSEIIGSVLPEKVVIVSGHLDSWDVGQGALDDGGGAFISWRSLTILKKLGLKPKQTIRSILWTAEEMGLVGAQRYVQDHAGQFNNVSLAMESDIGTFTPLGLSFSGKNLTSQCVMKHILQFLAPINATRLQLNNEGSDVTLMIDYGVPISSLDNSNDKYFNYHHTEADTMTVLSSEDLDKCLTVWTVVSYVVASLDQQLPR